MRPIFLHSVAFLLTITTAWCQTSQKDEFDRAFLEIYMQTASEDVHRALKAADSLHRSARSDVHRIRSLMLISDMHHRLANRDSSIHYVLKAERIAEREKNYLWLSRICGVLSTQYRETGLFSEGKRCLEKGLKIIENVDNPDFVNQFKGQSFQELGFYFMEEKKYQEAIRYFNNAETFFIAHPDSVVRYFALAQNEERLGLCYLELAAIDSAKIHFNKALALERQASEADTPVKGFIYGGLGRVYLAEGNHQRADSCFQKALAIADATGFPNLKISVYKGLTQYYRAVGDDDAYRRYSEKYLAEMQNNIANHRQYADHILARIQTEITQMAASSRVVGMTTTVFVVLMVTGMGLYIRKQKQNHRRFKEIVDGHSQQKKPVDLPLSVPADKPLDADRDLMPESTQKELLKKLERFEQSHQFRDRNISIAVLAGKMKTNTKYLSYIINTHRRKDFNNYINELRINYIVSKMEKDSRYLSYKISYLAEECGFATHSQFTKVFKNVTGMSPSAFMGCLKKNLDGADIKTKGR